MQITHEEARKLINLAADGNLNIREKQLLDSHLALCITCQQYAGGIQKMESILRPMLQRQWHQSPIPLSIGTLTVRYQSKTSNSMLLATRIAAVSLVFVVFMFSAWQFTQSEAGNSGPAITNNLPPIPIPSTSTQLISTRTQTQSCEEITYVVQDLDSLENIAAKFSTTKEEIQIANHLSTDSITTGMRLVIPVCTFTPTGTAKTLTTTPILNLITSTPGG